MTQESRWVSRAHIEHPGGRVGALRKRVHALLRLEVCHQLLRLMPCGAAVDCPAPALQQQQFIECLLGTMHT